MLSAFGQLPEMEVCEAGGDPSPCLARETAAAAAAAASTPSVADPHQQQQHHQKQQQQQQGQQRDFQAMKPLSFDEAERKKEKKKTQEYRQYLVQTRVIQTLVNLLLEIKERDPLPEDPQQVLIDYFGEYRDPVLDVIDELTEKKDKLTAENTNMTEELESLGRLKESLQEQNYQQKLWKALAKSGGMTAQILELVCPTGDPSESLSSANLKDDGENPILNAVATAIGQFQAKEA